MSLLKHGWKIVLLFFCFFLISCVSANVSYLQENGNYLDDGFTHTVSVKKLNVLNEFGITQKEWDSCFEGLPIYRAFSSGNAYASRAEVEQRAYDAIEIVGKNKKTKYVAIMGKNTDVSKSISSYTTYNNSTIYGNNGYRATVSTPQTNYYDVVKYCFDCYVIFFDQEEEISLIRNIFGNINVYELE